MKLKPISQWQWIPWEIRWCICSDPWESFEMWYDNYSKTEAQEASLILAIEFYYQWKPNPLARLFMFLGRLDLLMRSGSVPKITVVCEHPTDPDSMGSDFGLCQLCWEKYCSEQWWEMMTTERTDI